MEFMEYDLCLQFESSLLHSCVCNTSVCLKNPTRILVLKVRTHQIKVTLFCLGDFQSASKAYLCHLFLAKLAVFFQSAALLRPLGWINFLFYGCSESPGCSLLPLHFQNLGIRCRPCSGFTIRRNKMLHNALQSTIECALENSVTHSNWNIL